MATITWKIDALECKLVDGDYVDVVQTAHWRVYAQETDTVTSVYGSASFTYDGEHDFIDFEDLDEETVIEWVHTALGADNVAATEASATAQLETILHPVIENKPLPWA
jgi:hypothetical protein